MCPRDALPLLGVEGALSRFFGRYQSGSFSPMKPNVGRNDPCRCGSGKKYKRCCLPSTRSRQQVTKVQSTAGPRPIISAVVKDTRFVAVGNELHSSASWRTFPDFLNDYVKRLLGEGWGTRELSKRFEERHPLMQLYSRMLEIWNNQERGPDGLFQARPSGPMLAYLTIARDLYLLRDHMALQDRTVARLKEPSLFQGARYELFAAATLIRAGFAITHEDERDGTRRHPEFTATHTGLGETVAVEAKSRHRRGVLGQPAPASQASPPDLKAGVRNLLLDAFGKAAGHPYLVFVDVNLPPEAEGIVFPPRYFIEVLEDLEGEIQAFPDEPTRYTQIVLTNHPFHYGEDQGVASMPQTYSLVSRRPSNPFRDERTWLLIQDAAEKHAEIPNWFDERLTPTQGRGL